MFCSSEHIFLIDRKKIFNLSSILRVYFSTGMVILENLVASETISVTFSIYFALSMITTPRPLSSLQTTMIRFEAKVFNNMTSLSVNIQENTLCFLKL